MSLTLNLHSSTGRNPVSMLICNFSERVVLALAMSIRSFSLVGSAMFGLLVRISALSIVVYSISRICCRLCLMLFYIRLLL